MFPLFGLHRYTKNENRVEKTPLLFTGINIERVTSNKCKINGSTDKTLEKTTIVSIGQSLQNRFLRLVSLYSPLIAKQLKCQKKEF